MDFSIWGCKSIYCSMSYPWRSLCDSLDCLQKVFKFSCCYCINTKILIYYFIQIFSIDVRFQHWFYFGYYVAAAPLPSDLQSKKNSLKPFKTWIKKKNLIHPGTYIKLPFKGELNQLKSFSDKKKDLNTLHNRIG